MFAVERKPHLTASLIGCSPADERVEGVWGNREVPPQNQRRGPWGKHGFPHGSEPKASDV